MWGKRDHQGFEIEKPLFSRKVDYRDGHARSASVFIHTNDDTVFRGERQRNFSLAPT